MDKESELQNMDRIIIIIIIIIIIKGGGGGTSPEIKLGLTGQINLHQPENYLKPGKACCL